MIAASVAALSVTMLLAGCVSAAPVAVRTAPDQVEQVAVQTATLSAVIDRVEVGTDLWTQLWTPTRGSVEVAGCVATTSTGIIALQPAPVSLDTNGLQYSVGVSGVDPGVFPQAHLTEPLIDDLWVRRIVDRCIATYPIDFRLGSVPLHDRDALYAYDLTVLRRCLISHGQRVPRLPSRQEFDLMLGASTPWNAYDLVVVHSRRAWYALADACPALPNNIAGDVAALTSSAATP
jgi:outer membrane murein-binding lipoprotein Lpp